MTDEREPYVVVLVRHAGIVPAKRTSEVVDARTPAEAVDVALDDEYGTDGQYTAYVVALGDLPTLTATRTTETTVTVEEPVTPPA
jgi:hypothetical protein